VNERLATPKTSKFTWITQGDISKALLQLKVTQPLTDMLSPSNVSEDIEPHLVHNSSSHSSEVSSVVGKRDIREEQEVTWTPSSKRRRVSAMNNEAIAEPLLHATKGTPAAHGWAEIDASLPLVESMHVKRDHEDKPTIAVVQPLDCPCPGSLVQDLSYRLLCDPSNTLDQIAGIDLEQMCTAHLKLMATISLRLLGDEDEKTWIYLRAQRSVHCTKPTASGGVMQATISLPSDLENSGSAN